MAGRFVSTQPVVLALPARIPRLPSRGAMITAQSVFSAPGGGFTGLAIAQALGVEAVLASTLGTGPNSHLVRSELASHAIPIATDEVIGDIGSSINLIEDLGETTTIITSGVEAQPTRSSLEQIELRDGDILYVHGQSLVDANTAPVFAQWVAQVPAAVRVVVAVSPLVAEVSGQIWRTILPRVDLLSMNLREAGLLPEQLAQVDPNRTDWRDFMKPEAWVVRRMGALGAECRCGKDQPSFMVPSCHAQKIDTSGVGEAHVAAMCAALLQGASARRAVQVANAAGAAMISRTNTFPIPTRAEIEAFLQD